MNGEAVYQQIARDLREQITAGTLAPGAPVPGVTALAAKYGVTRVTSRHALRDLEQEGLIAGGRVAHHDRIPVALGRTGHGWAGESPTAGADSWGAAVQAAGRVPSQRIDVLTRAAEGEPATRLGLTEGPNPVIVTRLTRFANADSYGSEPVQLLTERRLIRYAGNEPHNMITFWFPLAEGTPLAGPESIAEGSIAWLENQLGPLDHTWEATPRMPAPDEAEILRIPRGVPVLEVWRTSFAGGRPVAVSRAIYPGDRTKITG